MEKWTNSRWTNFEIYTSPESAKNGLQDELGFIEIWRCENRENTKSRKITAAKVGYVQIDHAYLQKK